MPCKNMEFRDFKSRSAERIMVREDTNHGVAADGYNGLWATEL